MKPQAVVRETEVFVSHFVQPGRFIEPEQWQALLDKLISPHMFTSGIDLAMICLVPGEITTAQAVDILNDSGFEVSLAI